jgi:phosphatidylserine/phosphatidylglycerophosphate/cardiolipin synthase-like enzyme
MSINVKVYDNGDHACLVWLPADGKSIPGCRGFTIRRIVQGSPDVYLHGFAGFSDNDTLDLNAPWKHPVQRFMWWDYGVKPGQVVQYSVIPVTGTKDNLQRDDAAASPVTEPITISSQASPNIGAFFNKGIVSAQWVSRALAALGPKPKIADIIGTPGNPLRNALSGLLRPELLQLLKDVKDNGGHVYAALYELNDPELLAALTALGKNCHLILANGAFSKKNNDDENSAVRAKLKGVVDLHDRLVPQGHFAHNKFLVVCDSAGKPLKVLSGSTNWTMTGLCTQANNGIIVNDAKLAQYFVDEWNRLKAAGNSYPPGLAKENGADGAAGKNTFEVDGVSITQWFAPTDKEEDLDCARKLINDAKDGILFLFFNPGVFEPEDEPEKWTLLQNILFRHHEGAENFDAALYIRGVVNQEIAGLTTASDSAPDRETGEPPPARPTRRSALDPSVGTPVTLFSGGNEPPQRLGYESMVPKNIKDTFHDWATEILGQGVHIHSKVIVLDPFGAHPVVMTGSHNLGVKASSKNDDNLMIVEGNGRLAAAYAANIIAIYQAYRWNSYVEQHRQDPKVWHGLVDNDTWQQSYLDPNGKDLAELEFWMGGIVEASQPVHVPQAASPVPAPAQPKHPEHANHPHKAAAASKRRVYKKSPAQTSHRAAKHRTVRRKPK